MLTFCRSFYPTPCSSCCSCQWNNGNILRVVWSAQQVSVSLQHECCSSCSLSFPIFVHHLLRDTKYMPFIFFSPSIFSFLPPSFLSSFLFFLSFFLYFFISFFSFSYVSFFMVWRVLLCSFFLFFFLSFNSFLLSLFYFVLISLFLWSGVTTEFVSLYEYLR